MRPEQIRAVITAKTEEHPELRRPLGWNGFQRICRRERIRILVQPLPRPAQLVPYLGDWMIFLDKQLHPRRHTYYGAHELGHLWLHHDRTCDRWERCYNMDVEWRDDPREDDAENFATMVMQGPRFTARIEAEPPVLPPLAAPEPEGQIETDWFATRRVCDQCAYDAGRRVTAARAAEMLPHWDCRCDRGCRCRWEAMESAWK